MSAPLSGVWMSEGVPSRCGDVYAEDFCLGSCM